VYTDFDRTRFPIFTAAAGSLCGLAFVDDLARTIGERFGIGNLQRRLLMLFPLVLASLPILLGTIRVSAGESLAMWRDYQHSGTHESMGRKAYQKIQPLCRLMDADALVAVVRPWHYHLWCGNAAIRLPHDIGEKNQLERFLDREQPAYVVADGWHSALESSDRLRLIMEIAGQVLYEVNSAGTRSRPWQAPPPPACAGKPPSCARRVGR